MILQTRCPAQERSRDEYRLLDEIFGTKEKPMRLATIDTHYTWRLSILALTLFTTNCGSPAQPEVELGAAVASPAGSMVPARTPDPTQAALPQAPHSPTMTPRIARNTNTHESDMRTIQGTVMTTDGIPIEEAAIDLDPVAPSGVAFETLVVFSDARGEYRWDVRPGRYRLTVTAVGYQAATQEMVVAAHGPVTATTILIRYGSQ